MTIRNFVYQAIYAAMQDVRQAAKDDEYLNPPDPDPVDDNQDPIEKRLYTDVDSTRPVRRKVLEWSVNNVSTLKTIPDGKTRKARELIAHGINEGWSKKELQKKLVEKFEVTPDNAKRIALNEVRRAYNWAYKKTGYELGYRYVVWRVHPGACRKICLPRNGLMFNIIMVSIPEDSHPGCRCWLALNRTGFVTPYKKTLAPLPKLDQIPGMDDVVPDLLRLPEWMRIPTII